MLYNAKKIRKNIFKIKKKKNEEKIFYIFMMQNGCINKMEFNM